MVHSDNRLTCAIALAIFAMGIAVSVLLIAAYSRPFTDEISVGPQLLQQVIATERGTVAFRLGEALTIVQPGNGHLARLMVNSKAR
jgi:hypothetical protein